MRSSTLVIFGATGDLTHRKLIPALFHLFSEKKLPEDFNIVGFARREENREQHLQGLRQAMERFHEGFDSAAWQNFSKHLHYVKGDFDKTEDYLKLAEYLKQFDPEGSCTNKIFYMATAPEYFPTIIEKLEEASVDQMLGECWKRIIVEKPFGSDLTSAKKLNRLIDSKFDEREVYRIDHYLAKETVQNILAFRATNGLFVPLWNKEHIDHVQITVAEDFGVENRGGYYDSAGNLRDFIQNHLLQLLALVTMEVPGDLEEESVRDARSKALGDLKPLEGSAVVENLVLGQYKGYKEEAKVDPVSKTDTFTAMKVLVNNETWDGVPFYLRAGKQLPARLAYINVVFKPREQISGGTGQGLANVLTFHIQPKQSIDIAVLVKEPGQEMKLKPVELKFDYDESFKKDIPDAYEKLILDIIDGVQTFFPRADEVEASWKFLDPVLKIKDTLPLPVYEKGTWGPAEADHLLEKDGQYWINLDKEKDA